MQVCAQIFWIFYIIIRHFDSVMHLLGLLVSVEDAVKALSVDTTFSVAMD